MPKIIISIILSLLLTHTTSAAQEQTKTAVDFISLFEKLSGKHQGFRKAHASGICAVGSFTPNAKLTKYSTSTLFAQTNIPASVRFSLGSGNPNADERTPGVRGMAVQLSLPNNEKHTLAGNSSPVFAAKNPTVFFGLLKSLLPDETGQVNMKKLGKYIAEHPSTHASAAWQRTAQTPYSYANTEYYGLHTFFLVDADNIETKFRWRAAPDLGVKEIDKDSIKNFENGFLSEHLLEQVEASTISFTYYITLGEEDDTNIDPSVKWPNDRVEVEFGKLTITKVDGNNCDEINFDPNILSDGFKASADPVLRMRSPAYAISFGKRISGQ